MDVPQPSEMSALRADLVALGVPLTMVDRVPRLPPDTLGVMVYGSRARGDATPNSDLDLLVLVEHRRPSTSSEDVSVSYYTLDQLRSGRRTLFGAHLARDGRIISDPSGGIGECLSQMGTVDTERLFARAHQMSCILTLPRADLPTYLPGLLREARYLLRSCLYAEAIGRGEPCFSVPEIAARNKDPQLVDLLSSRQQGQPREEELDDCRRRLTSILGPLPDNEYGSLESLIVNLWDVGGDVLAMAFMALASSEGDGDYAEVQKILL